MSWSSGTEPKAARCMSARQDETLMSLSKGSGDSLLKRGIATRSAVFWARGTSWSIMRGAMDMVFSSRANVRISRIR